MVESVQIGGATLYCGDCREIAPSLTGIAAVIADPPYGVGEQTNRKSKGRGRNSGRLQGGHWVDSKDWDPVIGDDEPFDPSPWLAYPKVVLFGANHYSDRLPGSSCWLVWDKREESGPDDNADCEIAWTNLKGVARIHRQLWRGVCRRGEENVATGAQRLHPTQKPIALMSRAIELCKLRPGDTVLDPYMGSGPVGIAAVRRGLRYVGIEKDRRYFDVARRRIEEAGRQTDMFVAAPKPVQASLLLNGDAA